MKYKLSGDEAAPYYFQVNENTGAITLRTSLRQGREMTYRVGELLHFVYV